MDVLIGIIAVILIPIIFIGMMNNQSQRKYSHNPRQWGCIIPFAILVSGLSIGSYYFLTS
jgi:hypothetical protein